MDKSNGKGNVEAGDESFVLGKRRGSILRCQGRILHRLTQQGLYELDSCRYPLLLASSTRDGEREREKGVWGEALRVRETRKGRRETREGSQFSARLSVFWEFWLFCFAGFAWGEGRRRKGERVGSGRMGSGSGRMGYGELGWAGE